MNYYNRYPGDYIKKTLDLSMVEDGAYTRLLDWMYANEKPVPHEKRHLITRCQTAAERRAVDDVLAQFFEREGDTWTHERTLETIEEARPRIEAARENGKKGGRPKGSKNRPKPETQNPVDNKPSGFPEQNPAVTQSESSPYPIPHIAIKESEQLTREGSPAGRVCARIRYEARFPDTNPSDPRLAALLAAGVTDDELVEVAKEAVQKGKGWAWVLAAAKGRRADAAQLASSIPAAQAAPWWDSTKGIVAKGEELNCGSWSEAIWERTGEQWFTYRDRVFKAAQAAGHDMPERHPA